MNCDNCGKPAFIQVKIVGPFGSKDVNLCHECYEEYMNNLKKEIISNSDFKFDSDEQLDENKELFEEIAKQISDVVEHLPFEKVKKPSTEDVKDKSACPVCNMPFDELKNYSSIGCKYCYDHFRDFILDKRNDKGYAKYYRGKFPKNYDEARVILEKLDGLSEELFVSLENEEFEKCHDIQMKIDELELKLQEYREKFYE